MSVTSSLLKTKKPQASTAQLALAVADAGWFTTENLFREVDRPGVSTLLLKCMDYNNALRKGLRPWSWNRPVVRHRQALWQRDLVLPSGWMKRFPKFGMRPIGRSIDRWRSQADPDASLALVMTYPYYLHLRDMVRPERTVYYNIDDYRLYWPSHAETVGELERRAVRESDLTICVSNLRAEELRRTVPEAASKIKHLPHGAPASSLTESPWRSPAPLPDDLAHLPRPILGYVGTLSERVDWTLIDRVAQAFPKGSIVLVGTPPAVNPQSAWQSAYRRCLERSNVHFLGWRPQNVITHYNQAFDVCLIPYEVDHPFNRSCSPAKIMDYMVTGRPIVSTGLPECRLYGDLFAVATTHGDFIESTRAILENGSDDGKADDRHDWARSHTCQKVAHQLLDWLAE